MMFERVSKNVASANDLYEYGRDSGTEAAGEERVGPDCGSSYAP
jgi:hypothetical protein